MLKNYLATPIHTIQHDNALYDTFRKFGSKSKRCNGVISMLRAHRQNQNAVGKGGFKEANK